MAKTISTRFGTFGRTLTEGERRIRFREWLKSLSEADLESHLWHYRLASQGKSLNRFEEANYKAMLIEARRRDRLKVPVGSAGRAAVQGASSE